MTTPPDLGQFGRIGGQHRPSRSTVSLAAAPPLLDRPRRRRPARRARDGGRQRRGRLAFHVEDQRLCPQGTHSSGVLGIPDHCDAAVPGGSQLAQQESGDLAVSADHHHRQRGSGPEVMPQKSCPHRPQLSTNRVLVISLTRLNTRQRPRSLSNHRGSRSPPVLPTARTEIDRLLHRRPWPVRRHGQHVDALRDRPRESPGWKKVGWLSEVITKRHYRSGGRRHG